MNPQTNHLIPTECFSHDHFFPNYNPIYDIDVGNAMTVQDGEIILAEIPGKTDGGFLVSMGPISSYRDDTAWGVLHAASLRNKPVHLHYLDSYFSSRDLRLHGFVIRNGEILAVTGPEYLGVIPSDGVKEGFLVHNIRGVVRVDGTKEELLCFEILNS